MKNNSMTLTIADKMSVSNYSVWIGETSINDLIAQAYGVRDCGQEKEFPARVTIKIEDLSEPLRIERPERPAESEASYA